MKPSQESKPSKELGHDAGDPLSPRNFLVTKCLEAETTLEAFLNAPCPACSKSEAEIGRFGYKLCTHCRLETEPADAQVPLLQIPIYRFPVSVRLANVAAGVHSLRLGYRLDTLEDLTKVTAKDLMKLKNFGRVTLKETKALLASFGLSLAGP